MFVSTGTNQAIRPFAFATEAGKTTLPVLTKRTLASAVQLKKDFEIQANKTKRKVQ